jgi:hypothetical protein
VPLDPLPERLARGPLFGRLDLSNMHLDGPRWRDALAHPALATTRVLTLAGNNGFDASCAAALVASAHLAHLDELSLQGCPIGDDGLAALVGTPDFAHVARLELGATSRAPADRGPPGRFAAYHVNQVGDRGLDALASSVHAGGLVELHLKYVFGSAAAIARVCAAPWVGQLRSLRLMSCDGLGVAGTRALVSRGDLARLEELFLDHSAVGDEGLSVIAGAALPALMTLSLLFDGITTTAPLASSRGLPRLASIDLRNNPIGPAGVASWRRAPAGADTGLPALRRVGLSDCELYTAERETHTDWTGSVVGGGSIKMSAQEIQRALLPDLEVF